MSAIEDNVVLPSDQPSIEPFLIECKFTVESKHGNGGDWEKNIGGAMDNKRITFEGYATSELYNAVMNAVRNISIN